MYAGKIDNNTDDEHLLESLMTLLDLIEVQQDWLLASQRFQIARDCGYEVVFDGIESGEIH